MPEPKHKERTLPNREIAYAYTAAMQFSQELEVNLKAFLYSAVYHGWFPAIELDEGQKKRFKDKAGFIESATCGLLIEKLRATGLFKGSPRWKNLARACEYRNNLAHRFLEEHDFSGLTRQREEQILREIIEMTRDLYEALVFSRALRNRVELMADEIQENMQQLMRSVGAGHYENPSRHFTGRVRRTETGPKKSGRADRQG